MGSAYRLRTVKFWDSRQSIFAFYTTATILGILIITVLARAFFSESVDCIFCIDRSGGLLAVLLLCSLYFSFSGYQRLVSGTDETLPEIKRVLILRYISGILATSLSLLIYFSNLETGLRLFWPLVIMAILSEFSGRALFYMAQLPTGVYLLKE